MEGKDGKSYNFLKKANNTRYDSKALARLTYTKVKSFNDREDAVIAIFR